MVILLLTTQDNQIVIVFKDFIIIMIIHANNVP
jgi:hypothetical protein